MTFFQATWLSKYVKVICNYDYLKVSQEHSIKVIFGSQVVNSLVVSWQVAAVLVVIIGIYLPWFQEREDKSVWPLLRLEMGGYCPRSS